MGFMSNEYNHELELGISSISLSDNTIVFRGGSAGSWNISGFDTSSQNYIYWDAISEKIIFNNTPPTDPNSTNPAEVLNINQLIEKPVNKHDKYRIKFDYNIDTADIVVYYFIDF